jgi:phage replication-related protein YjqB (UPF0714/DUF867 family)
MSDAPVGACGVPVHRHVDTAEATFEEEYVHGENADLAALAPHGGHVEPHTDEQARLFGGLTRCRVWLCVGHVDGGGTYDRFHRTSTAIDPADYRYLSRLADPRPRTAVAFHGHADAGVAVGGAAEEAVKRRAAGALGDRLDVPVRVTSSGANAGTDPANVVNRFSERGGLQLEQSVDVRREAGADVVRTVARLLDG